MLDVEVGDFLIHPITLYARQSRVQAISGWPTQRLDAADAGDDLIFKCKVTLELNLLNDPQGAVIERRVSPDEERTAFSRAMRGSFRIAKK